MAEKFRAAGWWPGLADPLRRLGERLADRLAPRAEASVEGDAYEIAVELPGVAPEDVEVTVRDGALTVEGGKRVGRRGDGRSSFFGAREHGAFRRSFRLPPDADAERVTAQCRDGVLTVKVARRAPDGRRARRVAITRG